MAAIATARQIDSAELVTGPEKHTLNHGDTASPPALPGGLIGTWWRGWIAWATSVGKGGLR